MKANLLNERPIGTLPDVDSYLNILTPNTLLLGRASAKNPGNWQPDGQNLTNRYYLVQATVNEFWSRWIQLCAPTLLASYKWTTAHGSVETGYVVLIADKNSSKGDYCLGIIQEVHPSKDGKVRKALVKYKNYKVGERSHEHTNGEEVVVSRSIHRLALLVPVDYDQKKLEADK